MVVLLHELSCLISAGKLKMKKIIFFQTSLLVIITIFINVLSSQSMIIIIHLTRVILDDGETIDMAIIEIIMIINDHQNHDDDHQNNDDDDHRLTWPGNPG